MSINPPLRVIFNDAHASLPKSKHIPQGGPSRFSAMFTSYFEKHSRDIELQSLLFSHNADNANIFVRKSKGNHDFFEVVYPKEMLQSTYKNETTKKEYITYLKPLLERVGEVFEEAKPDIVFLNGFSLSNWLILETASRRNIPVCIQHAGIWKKELIVSEGAFSPSMRRIFAQFEKEILHKATHQIFLNEFSRDEFFKLHNELLASYASKVSVIPLPIEIQKTKKVSLLKKGVYQIGMVARWDRIKNHGAMMRLAEYSKKKGDSFAFNVVTKWKEGLVSEFKDMYEGMVHIIAPMLPEKLKDFYLAQDIVIIPSRFDVSPTVLMEALLCGKPVIISKNVGWVSDFKKFKLDQMVFDPLASGGNINRVINNLILNADTILPRYNKMQEKIIKENNPEAVFRKYYQLLKKIS